MPRYDRPAAKAAILARVAAGETVAGVARSGPPMPRHAAIIQWARADPLFKAALEDARRRGGWARVFAFDEAVAAAFLRRVAEGERVRDLLDRPGMPGQRAYRFWMRTQGEFQAAMRRIRAGKYSQASRTGHPRWRAWDAAVADRLLVTVAKGAPMRATLSTDPAFPSLTVLRRWRDEHRDFAAGLKVALRVGRRHREAARCEALAEAMTDEIGLKVLDGASLRALGGRDPDLPCAGTLYAWKRRFPAFARAMAIAEDMRAERAADARLEAAGLGGPFSRRR